MLTSILYLINCQIPELLKKSTNNLDKIDMVNEKINNNLQMITRYDKNNNKVMKKVNKEA